MTILIRAKSWFQTSINTIADLSSNNHNGTMLASYTNNLTNGLTLPTENCLNTD